MRRVHRHTILQFKRPGSKVERGSPYLSTSAGGPDKAHRPNGSPHIGRHLDHRHGAPARSATRGDDGVSNCQCATSLIDVQILDHATVDGHHTTPISLGLFEGCDDALGEFDLSRLW